MRVLFLQRQPCIRAIKYAAALRAAARRTSTLGFAYQGRDPDRVVRVGRRALRAAGGACPARDPGDALARAVEEFRPDLIHSHNLPDLLTVLALEVVGGARARDPRRPRHAEPAADALRGRLRRPRGPGRRWSGRPSRAAPGSSPCRARCSPSSRPATTCARAASCCSPTTRSSATWPRRPAPRGAVRRAAAGRLPGEPLGQRQPLRPARPLRGDRRVGGRDRRLPQPRRPRLPRAGRRAPPGCG